MKTLLTLLLVIPLFSWGQIQVLPNLPVLDSPKMFYPLYTNDSICIVYNDSAKVDLSLFEYKQPEPKWYSISKNDIWVMAMEVGAGYSQGWREEVLYHPHQLFDRFPGLNKKFWDARWSWQNGDAYKWDANHVLKGTTMAFHLAAVVIKAGDLKNYPKKHRWKKILFDAAKYYLSYQLGFALSYNLTHGNKLF